MKKIFIMLLLIATAISSHAQFDKAKLQASGLTCAMCSKAINNALLELPFVDMVKSDIQNSAFNISFKTGQIMNIDQLKKAVEDAGFAVASLKLSGNFDHVAIKNDEHIQIEGSTFHFLKVTDQTLNGEKEITVVDKNFLTAKDFKKISANTQMACIQTGKAGACCKKEGVAENTRIYHVTI